MSFEIAKLRTGNAGRFGAALLCAFAVGIAGCASSGGGGGRIFNSRRVDVSKIELLDRSFTDVALAATVELENRGSEPLTLDTANWSLSSGRRDLLEGSNPYRIALGPGESRSASVPVAFHLPDLYRQAPELRGQAQVPYDLTLTLEDSGDPNAQRLVARTRGVIDVPPAPAIRLQHVVVEELSYGEATVRVDIGVTPAPGAVQELRGLMCEVVLDGRPIVVSEMESLHLSLYQPTIIPLTVRIELGRENETAARILQRDEVRFRLTGHAALAGDWAGVLQLPLDDAGTIAITHAG